VTVYEEMRKSRRLVQLGIVIGYGLALVALVVRVANTEIGSVGEFLGSVSLAVSVAVAPSLAWISLDRRPGLLPVAALASFLSGLVTLLLLPVSVLVSLLWVIAWSRRPVTMELTRKLWWVGVALAFAPVLGILVMFSHLDPVCTETSADGTVVEVNPSDRGYPTGWRFGSIGSTGTATNQSGPDGPVSSFCTSNTVTWWEAALSAAVSLGVVVAGRGWPVNTPASRRSQAMSS
jgi:hypothetical protein